MPSDVPCNGAQWPAASVVCDMAPAGTCTGYDSDAISGENVFKNFNASTDSSYISTSTCGAGAAGRLVKASCADPHGSYWTCANVGFGKGFSEIGTFGLPPFLIKQACDKNGLCAAFTVNAVDATHLAANTASW